MPSVVDVINLALDLVGENPIQSEDDTTHQNETAQRIYPLCRDQVFRQFHWPCLKKRARLAASVTTPVFGYAYQFPIPADCIRIADIYSADRRVQSTEYAFENNKILCDEVGPLDIRYTARIEDVSQWDALLLRSVASYLAYSLATKIVSDQTRVNSMRADFQQSIALAKSAASQEEGPRRINNYSEWEQARVGGSYFYGNPGAVV